VAPSLFQGTTPELLAALCEAVDSTTGSASASASARLARTAVAPHPDADIDLTVPANYQHLLHATPAATRAAYEAVAAVLDSNRDKSLSHCGLRQVPSCWCFHHP